MNSNAHVIEVGQETFQADVVERSQQVPVLLEIYATEAEPSRELAPVLARLADSFQGKFLLARLDVKNSDRS